MRIDLGRRDIGVPQHDLDRPKVGPSLEEMAGKGVTERVGRADAPHAGTTRRFLDDSPEPLAGERAAATVHEQRARIPAFHERGARLFQVAADPKQCLGSHGN